MSRMTCLLALAALALYLLFGYRLGARDLWSSHEARAAMDAATLLNGSGPALVPYLFDGTPELQKPPLYYALAALAGSLLGGIDAVAVRLPALLAGLGCCALLALWLARRGKPLLGLLAATILATAVHFTLLARTARIDLPLAFATLAATLAFVEGLRGAGRRYLFAGYVALAAGLLLKGPIAAILLGAALFPWLVWERPVSRREFPSRLGLLWGVPLVALLVIPWLVWINAHTDGEFFRVFVWEHNIERGLGTGRLRSYPGWYYLPLVGVNFLPWSPLLLVAVVLALVRRWYRDDATLRLALAALGGTLLLLSLAAFKRADYLAPLYPWAAIITAVALERLVLAARYIPTTCVLVLLLAGVGQAVYQHTDLASVEPRRECATFAATMRKHAQPGELLVQFRTESHALAYHLGPGRTILLQWPDLTACVRTAGTILVAMPPGEVAALPAELLAEALATNAPATGGQHDRPLLLLRIRHREEAPPCPSSRPSPPSPTSP
jgi:4-amino-4-deoxy-L-arabinose transferase-like glycosyltransferase